MIIRPITVWDAYSIITMWGKMHAEITDNKSLRKEHGNMKQFFYSLISRIDRPEWHIVLAEDNGEVAGFIMSTVRFPVYNSCHIIGTCEALYVMPEYRGSGLYRELLQNGLDWAKNNKAVEFEFVGPYNERIMKFWDELGFEPVQVTYRQKEGQNVIFKQ